MTITRCSRCQRRYRRQDDWNATLRAGHVVGVLCPSCQTTAENTEAVVNEATLDYYSGADSQGRFWGRPKTTTTPEAS